MSDVAPHFYCDRCSNVLFRESDRDLLAAREDPPTRELLLTITRTLPGCPCGGHFTPGANPKCPECKRGIPHQDDMVRRLSDPLAILVEGALFVTEPRKPTDGRRDN